MMYLPFGEPYESANGNPIPVGPVITKGYYTGDCGNGDCLGLVH